MTAANFASLRAAVGLISAHVGGVDVDQAAIVDPGDEQQVIRCLVVVASAFLTSATPPAATDAMLQALGLEAARELAGRGEP